MHSRLIAIRVSSSSSSSGSCDLQCVAFDSALWEKTYIYRNFYRNWHLTRLSIKSIKSTDGQNKMRLFEWPENIALKKIAWKFSTTLNFPLFWKGGRGITRQFPDPLVHKWELIRVIFGRHLTSFIEVYKCMYTFVVRTHSFRVICKTRKNANLSWFLQISRWRKNGIPFLSHLEICENHEN